MVGLYKETMKKKIGVGEFVKLFPDHRTWSRKTRMFSGMWIEGIRITDIFSYPEEIRGERFRVQEVLGLIKGSYIKTVDCRTRELLLDPTEEELQGRGISSLKLAELIGIRFNTVYNCLDRKEDERLSKYLLAKVKLRGREIILFDRVKVLEDLEKLKEAFGLGGVRLPPQEGELTGPQLAELIGCDIKTLYTCLKREGDTRLDPYKKDEVRIVKGSETIVFEEAKVMTDLERLKEVFGLGGYRLPPQEGELTGPQLAELIGCDKHTLRSCLKREGDTRLDPYKKDIVRIVKGSETIVFDKEKVMADLAKLRIMFKVKKRIKDEKPEADDDGFSNAA
jgi:hypothetical protein